MPKIINGYRAGAGAFANALARAADVLGGDQVTPAVRREQLYALQRENSETDALAEMFRNPGYDPRKAIASGIAAGKVGDVADAHLFSTATAPGTPLDRVDAARRGAKMLETATFDHQNRERATRVDINNADNASAESQNAARIAEQRRQFDNTPEPVLHDGKPAYAPRSGVYDPAIEPILSNTERQGTVTREFDPTREEQARVLGADPGSPGTPRNYIVNGKSFITFDGRTDAQTGQPLPPGGYIGTPEGSAEDLGLTNSTQTDLQSDNIAYRKFDALVKMARPLTENPELFGIVGNLRSKAQEVVQALGGIQAITGARIDLERSVSPETARTLIPEFYDPRLSEVQSLWGLLLYQGASALAGQENRSVSDKDVQMMRAILGDPQSLFASGPAMAAKLDAAERVIQSYSNVNREVARDGATAPEITIPDAAPPTPKPGDIVDNHRFKGGDPADPASWEPL